MTNPWAALSRLALFSAFVVSSGKLQAQQVISVYDNQSMKAKITLPFYFKSTNNEQLNNVRVQSVSGSPSCLAQRDFFKTDGFLVKCENPGAIQLLVDYKGPSGFKTLSYGPLTISELRPGYTEPTATPPPTPTPDPRGATGRALIQNSCKSCHTTSTMAVGKTADLRNEPFASLKSAVVSGIRTMPSVSPVPSDAEFQAIEFYLKNIDVYGGWP